MYHVFESEMQQISSLNSIALLCFSVVGFMLSIAIAIFVSAAFSTQPLSELGVFLKTHVLIWIVIVAVLLNGFGGWFIWKKKSAIDLIKRETKTPQS